MEKDYGRILDLTFEIEGLALLIQHRGESAPAEIEQLLRDKVGELARLVDAKPAEACDDDDSAKAGLEAEAAAAELEQHEDADPFDIDDDGVSPAPAAPAKAAEPAASSPTADFDEVELLEEVPVVDEPEAAPADEQEKPVTPPAVPATEPKPELTLNDRLSINNSRDIRSAFTRNDYFLFKRELFGGKETDWADAMNIITAMNSYDEAEEYFISDLCWDPEREEVKCFLSKVRQHFA